MPARDLLPTSPSPGADDDEDQVLTRGKQTALSRRKTTAFDERIDPSLLSAGLASKAAAPRQSMPSRTTNEAVTTPRSNQSLAQGRIQSQELTPKRTPIAVASTVDKRFDHLQEYSQTILTFYDDYAARLADPTIGFDEEMATHIKRYWNMFSSSKEHEVYPATDNDDAFLDAAVVLPGNGVDPSSELAVEVSDKITEANRATFVHIVAQLPFPALSPLPSPEFTPWTVDKLEEYLSQGKHDRWPIRNIDELMLVRSNFFTRIVPRRRKVLVTLDDLHLFLDLCTQIAIHYIWHFLTVKNAKDRRAQIVRQIDYVFSANPVVDAFDEGDPRTLLENTYKKMVEDRMKRFEELKFAAFYVQKAFPFQVTAAALINYIKCLRTSRTIPIQEFENGLAIPRIKADIHSPSLLRSHDMIEQLTAGISGDALDGPQDPDEDQDQDAEGEVEAEVEAEVEQEQLPASGANDRLRFTKDSRLERVTSEQRANSIISRRGDVEAIRDTEFDEGDSDVFLERRTRSTATRGKGKKRAATTRKAKASSSKKQSIREGDSEDEIPAAAADAPVASGETDEEMPDAAALLVQTSAEQMGGQNGGDEAADFEVGQEELQVAQQESEARRGERQKRKRAEREDSEYLPASAEASTSQPTTQGSSTEGPAKVEKKPKQERTIYRYATGGNQLGRVAWSEEEKNCLLNDLEELYPRYLEALGRNVRFTIWKEVLKRHGTNGTLSLTLQRRNNVQCKDKARNEFERRKRAQEPIPDWLAPYG